MSADILPFKGQKTFHYMQLLLCISIGSVEFDLIRFVGPLVSETSGEERAKEFRDMWLKHWMSDSSGTLSTPADIYGSGKSFITKAGAHVEVILLSKKDKEREIKKGAAFLPASLGNDLLVKEMPLDIADKMVHAVYHFNINET